MGEIDLVRPSATATSQISDGTTVSGLADPRPRPSPDPDHILLDVHGGPHNAWNGAADEAAPVPPGAGEPGWARAPGEPAGQRRLRQGRSSTAAVGGWGEADASDFLDPLDVLVAEGIADPQRLAVTGYSYGGYMTCYLTSRSDRFAAAVAGGVCSDLSSLTGTADAGYLLATAELARPAVAQRGPAGPAVAVQPGRERPHSDPRLPGDRHLRCPVGQAQQWHSALRELGVPTRLVLYPGASHLFVLSGAPSHRVDFNQRIVDWVEQYAGGSDGVRPPTLDAAHWQRRLTELAARHHVPGAQLAILRLDDRGDELVQAASGVLNVDTGVPTTVDSVFQIGSISKVWTATVVMQLVDEGKLELEAR